MSKSYEDYDKVTKGDIIREKFKFFLLALAGGLIGSIPYVVLWCFFSIDSLIVLLLSGASAIAFMMEVGKIEKLKWLDHILIILGAIISVAISDIVVILVHFVPEFEVEGDTGAGAVRKLLIILRDSKLDSISVDGLVTDGGSFSIYTEFFFGVFFALLGIYLAFLFIKLSGKSKKSKKVNKK